MPELGSAVFHIRTDAKDFHKDLDAAEKRANKMAANVGDSFADIDRSASKSFKSVDKSAASAGDQLQLFNGEAAKAGDQMELFAGDVDYATKKVGGFNSEVKKTSSTTRDADGWIKKLSNSLRGHSTDTDNAAKSHDKLITKLLKVNIATKFLGNTMKLLKWPAMITGAGLAAGGLAQLTAGAVALVGAMGPLTGAVAALPAGLTAMASSMITVKLAMSGVGDSFKNFGEQLKKPTIESRRFGRSLEEYIPKIRELQKAAQGGLFSGITAGLKNALPFFPIFKRSVGDVSNVLGDLAASTGRMIGSGAFGKMFGKIAKTNTQIIGILGDSLQHVVMALMHVMVAARPLTKFMAESIQQFSHWAAGAAKAGDESGKLASFFHQTQVALQRWGSIIGNVVAGLYNIAKAAAPAGRDLARSLDIASGHFRRWTESTKGKNQLKEYFDNVVPSVEAAGRLVRTISRAFFRLGNSTELAPMLDQIRTQFIPVLEDLLKSTSESMGPAFIDLLTNVGRVLAVFIGQSGPLLNFVKILGGLAGALADILDQSPEMQAMLTTMVGFAGVAKAVRFTAAITGITKLMGLTKAATVQTAELAAAEQAAGKGAAPAGAGAGKNYMMRFQAAAVAGVAGWELGTLLRNKVPAVRAAGDFLGKSLASALGVGVDKEAEKISEALYQSTTKADDAFKKAKDPVEKMRASLLLHKNAAEASAHALAKQQAQLLATGASMDGTDKKSKRLREVTELLRQKTSEASAAARGMGMDLDSLGVNFKRLGGTVKETSSYILAATNQVLAGLGAKTIKFSLERSAALKDYGGTSSHATGGVVGNWGEHGRDNVYMVGRGEAVVNRHQQPIVNAGLAAIGMTGGLPELFSKVRKPHYYARGGGGMGITAPSVIGPPGMMRDIATGVSVKETSAANKLISKKQAQLMAALGGSTTGLVPQVKRAIIWARSHGWHGSITSGFRSRAQQEALWANRANNPNPVARPGTSNHERGLAIDVTDPAGFNRAMATAPPGARLIWYGSGDPVHFSVTGRKSGGFLGKGGLTKKPRGWSDAHWKAYKKANKPVTMPSKPSGKPSLDDFYAGANVLAGFAFDPKNINTVQPLKDTLNTQLGSWTKQLPKFQKIIANPYKDPKVRKLVARKYETKAHLKQRQRAFSRNRKTKAREKYANAQQMVSSLTSNITGAQGTLSTIDDNVAEAARTAALAPLEALRAGGGKTGALGLNLIGQHAGESRLTQTLDDDVAAQRELVEQRRKEYEAAKATGLADVIAEAANNYADAIDGLKTLEQTQAEAALNAKHNALSRQAAEARLTETMDDDIAAAKALEEQRRQEYEDAKKTGDDAKIADAANNLADASQSLDQLTQSSQNSMANIQALLDRTTKERDDAKNAAFLANAFIAALRSSPDINYGYNGPPITIQTLHPADPATLDAIGQAATAGISLQGSVTSPRTSLGV